MNKYGLVGYPLKHSFSQRFFTEKFASESIDAVYSNYEIENIGLLPAIIDSESELRGLNVTIPYKEQIIPFLDELDEGARKIGAVNVIKIEYPEHGKRKLIGYNSDIIGFQNSIQPLINKTIHQKALVLGTGGASKAIVRGLLNLGISSTYVSRTPKPDAFTYNDLNSKIINEYRLIVNTSPTGTFPNIDEAPDIPYQYLTDKHLLYDLVYNPAETSFLKRGKAQGAITKNGAEMLELQAIAAWEIWNR